MAFSAYLENKLVDHVFGAGTFAKPATLYLALTVGGVEVSGNGYARQAATFSIAGNVATLSATINFPAATGSWGAIDGVKVFDALTVGNELASGTVSPSQTISAGNVFQAPSGDITVTLT